MPLYKVSANFTIEADNKTQALVLIGTAVEYWDEVTGEVRIQGIGRPEGYVHINEMK